MSCGLTIVATNTEINKKLLANNGGFLIESDVESIIEGIENAILANRSKISQRNRKYVINNYNWKKKVEDILGVIK